jgi:hypothetical protein
MSDAAESARSAKYRTKALDGFDALFAAVKAVADGSEDPGDIVDDALCNKYYEGLCDLEAVHEIIKKPAPPNKMDDDEYQDAMGEMRNTPDLLALFRDFPGLDYARFKRSVRYLNAYNRHEDSDEEAD